MNADVVVIGAGTVGASIAYGLTGRGMRVLVLDGGDRDLRAASANFGLVWLHGKGLDMPDYNRLTRYAVDLWPEFEAELTETTGIDLQYERSGGLVFSLGELEFEKRRANLMRLHNQLGGSEPDWEMLDRESVAKLLPKARLGPGVAGASFGRRDGHANPLRLLIALQQGIQRRGGELRGGSVVRSIGSDRRGGFVIETEEGHVSAARVIIAAGLGSQALAAQVGLDIPIRPQRGQILVTERLEPFLPLPTMDMRQTREGTVMIGTTNEEAGLDPSTTSEAAAALSANALESLPAMSEATLIRQWSGLRILTPDSYPVYAESQSHPGAYIATCHSGVTLASAHASLLAQSVIDGRLAPSLEVFHHRRFDVQQAA